MHVHTRWTAIEVLKKKKRQLARQSKSMWPRGKLLECSPGMQLDSEKVGPTLGVVEGIYGAYFNQIHARNIIKHSETQIM